MFEIVKPGTRVDFVGRRRIALAVSALLIVVGTASIIFRGLNYGIDFAGGTMVHLRFEEPRSIGELRTALGAVAEQGLTVQDFGGSAEEFMVRMPESDPELKKGLSTSVQRALAENLPGANFEVLRVESVGPRVGRDLRQRALLAVLAATLMMGLYITLRFRFAFGVAAGAALLHDVIVTVGALSLFGFEFDLNIVAALLTVVGFSVNDTVIISDRIRENDRQSRRESLAQIINRSVNETLSRTILTTGTALVVILSLFFLGGDIIHGFAFTLLVGFTIGTYSSIAIVGSVVLAMPRPGAAS